ncbi:MAG: DUF5668 domain-containing protein [Candidatus Staskawiczbacteria bacterium]|jgi:hypothetical protein
MENGKECKCAHHKIMPCCIILIGLAVLLMNLNIYAYAMSIIWPILLIVIGVKKLMKCKCC